jgi:GNAT superfamily N-acetyltransferase
MFAFHVIPNFFYFAGELTANEVCWCVEKNFRRFASLKLLEEAEKMASEMGAKRMMLTAPEKRIGRLYERRGYDFIEMSYFRMLPKSEKTWRP